MSRLPNSDIIVVSRCTFDYRTCSLTVRTVDFNTDGPQCNPAIELNNDHSYANMVEWN